MRMYWEDQRLMWNESDPRWEGITKVPFLGASYDAPEASEIWLPDITPYNAIHGLSLSFEPATAQVSSDGKASRATKLARSLLASRAAALPLPRSEPRECASHRCRSRGRAPARSRSCAVTRASSTSPTTCCAASSTWAVGSSPAPTRE
eukprot:6493607-Prymnesium_polylepis.1